MRRFVSSVLLTAGVLLLWGAPAAAQVTVTPDTIAVSLAEGEAAEVVLTVSNAGADTTFALSLAPAPGPDGTPGDFLFATAPEALPSSIRDLAMTPDGRLFVAEDLGRKRTSELTPELDFVQLFDHPTTNLLSLTVGLAYRGEESGTIGTGTLWWLDFQGDGEETEQSLLLEGTLNGTPTGRSISVPFSENGDLCLFRTGRPSSVAYETGFGSGAGSFLLYGLRK